MVKITCAVDEIKSLTPDEVRAIMNQDKAGEYLILDVRQPQEYQSGHIPGATLVPLGELEARQEELDRNRKIITYCRSGHRSMAAAIALCGLGFKGVQHLDGGILNWTYETIARIPEARPELITKKADVRDILVLAMKLEKGSRDFYTAASNKTSLIEVKDMFQMLADAEYGHMQKLYESAINLLGEGALLPLDKLQRELKVEHMEGGIEISSILARVDEKVTNEIEALEIALEKEYMSYDFYKRASALVENPEAKALLHELALEERRHADKLLEGLSGVVQ
jgi:rhodanese-related sulfurtransferase/rubrerythrin